MTKLHTAWIRLKPDKYMQYVRAWQWVDPLPAEIPASNLQNITLIWSFIRRHKIDPPLDLNFILSLSTANVFQSLRQVELLLSHSSAVFPYWGASPPHTYSAVFSGLYCDSSHLRYTLALHTLTCRNTSVIRQWLLWLFNRIIYALAEVL